MRKAKNRPQTVVTDIVGSSDGRIGDGSATGVSNGHVGSSSSSSSSSSSGSGGASVRGNGDDRVVNTALHCTSKAKNVITHPDEMKGIAPRQNGEISQQGNDQNPGMLPSLDHENNSIKDGTDNDDTDVDETDVDDEDNGDAKEEKMQCSSNVGSSSGISGNSNHVSSSSSCGNGGGSSHSNNHHSSSSSHHGTHGSANISIRIKGGGIVCGGRGRGGIKRPASSRQPTMGAGPSDPTFQSYPPLSVKENGLSESLSSEHHYYDRDDEEVDEDEAELFAVDGNENSKGK